MSTCPDTPTDYFSASIVRRPLAEFSVRIVHSHEGLKGICDNADDLMHLTLQEAIDCIDATLFCLFGQGQLFETQTIMEVNGSVIEPWPPRPTWPD